MINPLPLEVLKEWAEEWLLLELKIDPPNQTPNLKTNF